MPVDDADNETAPPPPSDLRDAEQTLKTMAHDARNGLAAIVARSQMLARRLRRGDSAATERVAHDVAEIEHVAKRTAGRIDEIEKEAARRSGSGPLTGRHAQGDGDGE